MIETLLTTCAYGVAIYPKGVAIYHWCGYFPCGVAISPEGVAISGHHLSLGSCRSQKHDMELHEPEKSVHIVSGHHRT